jgi:hypothetical protein
LTGGVVTTGAGWGLGPGATGVTGFFSTTTGLVSGLDGGVAGVFAGTTTGVVATGAGWDLGTVTVGFTGFFPVTTGLASGLAGGDGVLAAAALVARTGVLSGPCCRSTL